MFSEVKLDVGHIGTWLMWYTELTTQSYSVVEALLFRKCFIFLHRVSSLKALYISIVARKRLDSNLEGGQQNHENLLSSNCKEKLCSTVFDQLYNMQTYDLGISQTFVEEFLLKVFNSLYYNRYQYVNDDCQMDVGQNGAKYEECEKGGVELALFPIHSFFEVCNTLC